MRAELRFRAMGTTGLVAVNGGRPDMLVQAKARVDDLEAKWSRFRAESEVVRLGEGNGQPIPVSRDTFELVAVACAASQRTHGAFDPTVADAMVANGYDVSFDAITPDAPPRGTPTASPGCDGVELDASALTVALPAGTRLDAGGIGKGFAADLVSAMVMDLGADGVLVDLGGDIRCRGVGPEAGRWVIEVEAPFASRSGAGQPLTRLALTDGAVATSSTQRRRWGPGNTLHHIVHPRTGRPAASPIVAATVVAGDGWWAEALATAIVVRGDLAAVTDAEAVAVRDDGSVLGTATLLEMCA